jgi:uncharacterized BrkB/YihY/UPF0761 family membrane protein
LILGNSIIEWWRSLRKFGDDQAGNLVALLTYFAFLATLPLLLALTTILALVLRSSPALQRDLVNSAFRRVSQYRPETGD